MKVKYCKLEPGNFGDELNVYIWPKLIPELINQNDLNYLIGIGTILGNKYNNLPGKKLVFTSGTGYEMGAIIDNTWDIVGVRGKKQLNYMAYHLTKYYVMVHIFCARY